MSVQGCRIIGVTGRSGSGKSTVCQAIHAAGFPVLDGDVVARQITQPGSSVLKELAAVFGTDILDGTGNLRRQLLADRAFSTPEGTRLLTQITHPAIVEELMRGVDMAARQGARFCFVDGAAIVGHPFEQYCDCIVVVTAPQEDALLRIQTRDGIGREAALRRLNAQTPEAELRAAARYIIENNGSREQLLNEVWRLLAAIRKEFYECDETT